ncbi:NADPH2:quinone reductase [Actinomadura madurae]|uniref:NADPH2:quinone reductase n=2 Tax=Actinomadura madurae TaxID=1993 RepID=A0A1I5HYB2_9ACTN|nr:NADPH2:quinone reductase [Actinomadura madurae]
MSEMSAVVVRELGGPEALRPERTAIPEPGAGAVLIRVSRSVVNFADDRMCRTGVNHFTGRVDPPPFVPGGEIVGTRRDTGERVVALCRTGGYAQFAVASEDAVFPVPEQIEDEAALAVFVPGLTAAFLLDVAGLPAADTSVVIHGASGAVGRVLLRLLRGGPCRVIASASTPRSREGIARDGTTVIDAEPDGLTERIRAACGGRPVDVVLDPIGGPVLEASLGALAPRGRLVTFGNASGAAATVDPRSLIVGSRTVTGFWLMDHTHDRAACEAHLARLFALADDLATTPARTFPLDEAAKAMTTTRERAHTSRVLLDPWA